MDISWTYLGHGGMSRTHVGRISCVGMNICPLGGIKKATDDEGRAKIGMSVHTRKEQDMNDWKVWPEIGQKLTVYRTAKIGQIEQFRPDTINLDCVTTLCHSHIIG